MQGRIVAWHPETTQLTIPSWTEQIEENYFVVFKPKPEDLWLAQFTQINLRNV